MHAVFIPANNMSTEKLFTINIMKNYYYYWECYEGIIENFVIEICGYFGKLIFF